MKRIMCVSLSVLFSQIGFSQTDSLQREINDQVWKPFINAFNNGNTEAFSAVHSKDVTRVVQDDKHIMGYNEYFKKVPDSVKAKWSDWEKKLSSAFFNALLQTAKHLKWVIIKAQAPIQKQEKKEQAMVNFMC